MISSKNEKASIFEGIPEDLPSLSYAYRLTQKAARLGFDWPDLAEVLKKMDEELGEFREALAQPPHLLGGVARSRSLRVATPSGRLIRRGKALSRRHPCGTVAESPKSSGTSSLSWSMWPGFFESTRKRP